MSEAGDAPPEDGIPPGKRLVRAGGGAGLSLSERLANQFYRIAWKTPLHKLKLRGRFPLKLLGTVSDPTAGDLARGNAILDGRIEWRGETLLLADTSPDLSAASTAMVDYYHGFAWLRDVAATPDRKHAANIAATQVRAWIERYGNDISEPAWRAEQAGSRLLHWSVQAPLILAENDLVFRSLVLNTLARTARHLDGVAGRMAPGGARISSWCGLVAASLLIGGREPSRAFAESGLSKSIAVSLSDDGGLTSRSPHEQFLMIEHLALLRAVYEARSIAMPADFADAIALSLPALLGLAMGDGGLSSWQGCLPLGKDVIGNCVAATGLRSRPLRQARNWGYQKLTAGQACVVFDAAPPPHARDTKCGCASTLALEFSDGAHRLIVNCGGAASGGPIAAAGLGDALRSTAAHSTLVLADTNSTAVLAGGGLGKGVDEILLDREETEIGSKIEASHDGYARRFGYLHKRSISLAADGRELRGEDTLVPATGKKKPNGGAFAVRFHLGPGTDVSPTADALGALIRIDGGPLWQFRCRGGSLAIEPSLWTGPDGRWQSTSQIVVSGEAAPGGATIGWVFRRAG